MQSSEVGDTAHFIARSCISLRTFALKMHFPQALLLAGFGAAFTQAAPFYPYVGHNRG